MSDTATSPAASVLTPEPSRRALRFSLAGMMLTMTLLAVALAVVVAPLWDADERLILASWFVGVLGLASIDRVRGKRGIVPATLGGGLVPAGVVLVMLGMGNFATAGIAAPLWVGSLGAAVAALAATALDRLYPLPQFGSAGTFQLLRNSVWPPRLWLAGVVAGAIAVGATVWLWPWRPVATLMVASGRRGPIGASGQIGSPRQIAANQGIAVRDAPPVALSAQGDRLAVAVPSGLDSDSPLQVWHVAWPLPRRELSQPQTTGISYVDFSSDDSMLALTPRFRGQLRTMNRATGEVLVACDARDLSSSLLLCGRFDDTGQSLIVRGWSPTQHSLLLLDPRTLIPMRREDFAGSGASGLSSRGNKLAQLQLPPDQSGIGTIEVLNGTTLALEQRFESVPAPLVMEFSPDERRFVAATSVWNLAGGDRRELPGEAWGFADGGRLVAVVRHDRGYRLPRWLPPWAATLPFLRHVNSAGPRSQLLLVEAATGQHCCASRWQRRIDFVAISRDGRRIATSSPSGQVMVRDVPRRGFEMKVDGLTRR